MSLLASVLLAYGLSPAPLPHALVVEQPCMRTWRDFSHHQTQYGYDSEPTRLAAGPFLDRFSYGHEFLRVCSEGEIRTYPRRLDRDKLTAAREIAKDAYRKMHPRFCDDAEWSNSPHRRARRMFISSRKVVCPTSGDPPLPVSVVTIGGSSSSGKSRIYTGRRQPNGELSFREFEGPWSRVEDDGLLFHETEDGVWFLGDASTPDFVEQRMLDALSDGIREEGLTSSSPVAGTGPETPQRMVLLGYVLAGDSADARRALELMGAVDPETTRSLLETARAAEKVRMTGDPSAPTVDTNWTPKLEDAIRSVDSMQVTDRSMLIPTVDKELGKSALARALLRVTLEDQPSGTYDIKIRDKRIRKRYRGVEFKDVDPVGNLVFEQDGSELVVSPSKVRSVRPAREQ